MNDTITIRQLLSAWPATIRIDGCESLGNRGGLSGAGLWKVTNDLGSFCLRRWPVEYPPYEHLRWIHERLIAAANSGCHFIPQPLAAFDGSTFLPHQGHLWELTPWMPGRADFRQRPTLARLENGLRCVAQLHLGLQAPEHDTQGPAPGLHRRWQILQAEDFSASAIHRWRQWIDRLPTHSNHDLLAEMLQYLPIWFTPARDELAQCRSLEVPLQACVRDLWHAHLLFQDDAVSGIVDFGSMQVDCVCADLVRLLGTMIESSVSKWRAGLDAYQHLRPLTANERRMMVAYDISSTLLSSVQWLRWMCDEQRTFEDTELVSHRLQSLLTRLREDPVALWRALRGA